MTAPRPRAWVSQPLIEWTPWELDGYDEAEAKSARGELINGPAASKPTATKRQLRSVESLQSELDRVVARLAAFETVEPVDTAAARLGASTLRAHYKHTDSQLERFAKLTHRRDVLEAQIRKRSA